MVVFYLCISSFLIYILSGFFFLSYLQPIPDSLHTLSEFMNRMELALSQNGGDNFTTPLSLFCCILFCRITCLSNYFCVGYQQDQSPNNRGDLPTVELPSSARGLSTPETLIVVLRHAERLLSGHAVAALSVCSILLYSFF